MAHLLSSSRFFVGSPPGPGELSDSGCTQGEPGADLGLDPRARKIAWHGPPFVVHLVTKGPVPTGLQVVYRNC